ncbi:AvrD family protein [Microbacterium sp. CH-015]|uniref:AvrD family protein n=1 Tax=Microbacterium sp. CH-015 TaxID=3406734 RepID=UPI003C73B086
MAEETIESQLGAARGRFFGNGYSRVRHSHTLRRLRADGADYSASVLYPTNWSEKNGAVQLPHLASVDAMALAVSIVEDYLSRGGLGDPVDLGSARIRSCDLIPGAHPTTELTHMPVRLDVDRPTAGDAGWNGVVVLGAFKVRIGLGQLRTAPHAEHQMPAGETYFGGVFRAVQRRLGVVSAQDGIIFEATALAQAPTMAAGIRPGIDLAYNEKASMLDALVFCAQVGQVAIYSLDGLDRAETDTLWLRRARFVRASPPGDDAGGSCRVVVERTSLIERDSSRWRTADLVGKFASVEISFRLAHLLPAADRARVTLA